MANNSTTIEYNESDKIELMTDKGQEKAIDFNDNDDDIEESSSPEDHSSEESRSDPSSTSVAKQPSNPKLAAKESKQVYYSKILVALVLVGSATGAAITAYKFSVAQDVKEFKSQFNGYADEIVDKAGSNAFSTFAILSSLSTTVTSYAKSGNISWPFVTVPDFERRGNDYLSLSGAQLLAFAPLVKRDDRERWEPYSIDNQGWIHDGLLFERNNFSTNGNTTAVVIPTAVRDKIWINGLRTSKPIPEFQKDQYAPIWQVFPAPSDDFVVNYNLLSHPDFEPLLEASLEVKKPVLSEVLDNTVLFGSAKSNDDNPKSVVVQPVFRNFDPDADIVGFLIVIIPWDIYLQNSIFSTDLDLYAVLRNSCNEVFTYIINGVNVNFLGAGDLHDTDYDNEAVSADFNKVSLNGIPLDRNLESFCDYSLYIYPSKELEESSQSKTPIQVTVGVLVVFLFTSMVFVLYDFFVQRRQKKVVNTAERTTAIVSSLFPREVHERLFQLNQEDEHGKDGGADGNNKTFRLQSLVAHNAQDNTSTPDQSQQHRPIGASFKVYEAKPIADLFADCTVMFSDISGFTAWSSIREPSQVFTLLETIYSAFDSIAKKRRVFKVETIGDCYVAVAGLPTPRKDHAVAMARFAHSCLLAVTQLLHQLEGLLGPGTAELAMRFGLNSGPVTAGVLRGEKSRFQLFGDTVNTASRMESTGERNKIQCSAETARILKDSGKTHWLIPRHSEVTVKGKGAMHTWWVMPKMDGSGSSCGGSATGSDSQSNEQDQLDGVSKLPSEESLSPKMQRLVDWNAEKLEVLLKNIVTKRKGASKHHLHIKKIHQKPNEIVRKGNVETMVLDEVKEVITLPGFDAKSAQDEVASDVALDPDVVSQLRDFVGCIASMHRRNPFHNFFHASHVTMSVSKLLSRIVAPQIKMDEKTGDAKDLQREFQAKLHDHTFGITSDPLTHFAVVLSALIHDIDHPGVPNATLVKEKAPLAELYKNQSVAEQNSVDIAWDILMDDNYLKLRACIYETEDELKRFRQLLVNSVMATDIADKSLGALRRKRWEKAFDMQSCGDISEDVNRKATIVIEHLLQASDVAHTMQYFDVYLRWNERLFEEMYQAYKQGRSDKDPSENWYQGELGFFDFYIIPLAQKLKECGVFGVSCDEYLNYAVDNRRQWESRGKEIVQRLIQKVKEDETSPSSGASEFT